MQIRGFTRVKPQLVQRTSKQFGSLVTFASILLLILAGVIALSARTTVVGGYHVFAVLTGSMEPDLPVHTALLVHTIDPTMIRIGDIITFEEPGNNRVLITHRVIAIDTTAETKIFRTKGDANPAPDPWRVPSTAVKGKVYYHIPWIGSFIAFLNTKPGIALFVILPVLFLVYDDVDTIQAELLDWRQERTATNR